jgi:hypothetical protein
VNDMVPVAIVQLLRCARGDSRPVTVIVRTGEALCSEDALEWWDRERRPNVARETPRPSS